MPHRPPDYEEGHGLTPKTVTGKMFTCNSGRGVTESLSSAPPLEECPVLVEPTSIGYGGQTFSEWVESRFTFQDVSGTIGRGVRAGGLASGSRPCLLLSVFFTWGLQLRSCFFFFLSLC